MAKFGNFLKIWGVVVFLTTYSFSGFSQVVYNNGLDIYAKEGAIFFVDGTVQNQSGLIEVEENGSNYAELIIQQDFVNNATAGGDGYYRVLGNWINNNTFNAGTGTVFLEGGNQFLDGSVSTYFNNLTLDGSGLKTQTIDQYCTGILNLKHLELQNETFGFYVQNTNVNAIIRTTGFVSALNGGFLSRKTNLSSMYLFPVGSSLGTLRYRPAEITPENAVANTYTVRMANVLATTESYDVNALPPKICEVNPEFYHQVNRTSGTAAIELDVFYNETVDGTWDGLASWTTPPDLWQWITPTTIVPGTPFNKAVVNAWNDFSELPYILYRVNPDATITNPGAFCETDASLNLTSVDAGGTWSGTGITNATNGTFNPTTAGVGTHTISYTVGTGACEDTDQIDITVYVVPDATINDPGDFCLSDAAVNLSASSTGGTWSGTGITNTTNGTFNPTTAGSGTHTITYNVGTGSCTDSDNIIITVNATPNATITDPGDFCSTDAAENLVSATVGGTWSGTGITNASTGTFNPASANIGANNITYTITTAGCTGTANISIDVFDTPDATITNPGAFCSDDAAINLTAASTGGTWSGTGITNATNGTFNPTTAGAGTHTITYNVGTGSCTDSDNIIITVNASPNATITDPGDFCNTDAALNLSAATAGGTWSGTGITNASTGTFDPASANIGANNITYTLTVLGCTGTANISIDVFVTPDATITNPGTFCDNDAAINLTASSTGGTWSGTGITNAANGTFNPTSAGAGTHTITYNVGTGTCTDSDNIIITVNASPNATITDPGDFCSTDAALNLSSATAGGTWSGTGITNASTGTFNPASANIGANNITYTLTVLGCTGTDNISIDVFDTPDATITNPGAFCSDDAAINLTAASTGGTWSGAGITNATNGTFNPTTAGAGTHTITYNVGTGSCTDSDNIIITVNASPNATITDPGDFCSTDAALNLSSATAGGTWSGTGITNASTGTFDPASANIGTNNISYTITTSGCTGTANISIDVFDTPDATITNPGAFCDNDAAIDLTAASTGGTWSGTGITNAANGTFNPTSAGAGTHTITYNVGTGTCTDSDNIIITVNASPNATITDPGDFCSTDAALNLSSATAGGTWSGTGITNASTGTFNPASANIGANNITYTLTVLGCTGTDNISIDVFDTPDATITNPGAFCDSDAAINLTASSTGGTWSGTGITNAANGTFNPTTAGAGTHTITYNVGTGSCTDSDNIIITVNATPNATITDPGDFCSTDAALNLSSATAGGTWSGTGITNTSTGTFNPASANIGTNNITYTLTVLGCTGTDNISIVVFDTPDATITNPGAFCSDDAAINLTANSTGGTWSGTGITNAANGTFNPTTAGAGTHTITYNVGTGSCTDSDNIVITVNASPNATITDPGDFCSTDAALNLASATAGGTWSGTGITNASTGTFNPASANIGTNNITYTLTVLGCTGTDNISIVVFDTPDATITNPGAFCSDDAAINLTAASTGGTWSGTGITNATNGTFNPTTAGAGTHTITYNVGTGSCTDSDNIVITVNASPNATITDPGDFCSTDEPVYLIATPLGGDWSGSGIVDPVNGLFNPNIAGDGIIQIIYTITENGCMGSDIININVSASPDVTINPVGPFCYDYSIVQLTAETAGGTWSGPGTTSDGQFNIAEAGVGVHKIKYTFTGNCGAVETINIEIFPSNIYASYDVENPLCHGGMSGEIDLFVHGGTPPYVFNWGEDGYSESIHLNNLASGIYSITIMDVNGCSLEVNDIIIQDGADDCIEIPNAFTPNADGFNDQWIISNIDSFDNYYIQVFNRWGQEIYYGMKGIEPWDGTWNGRDLPTGAYLYIIQIDDIKDNFVGIVTLIK